MYDGNTTTYRDVLIGFDEGVHNFIKSNESVVIDAGGSTKLTIKSSNSGESVIELYGDTQGTGRIFVGQSPSTGGGIEYNGDSSPDYTGAGDDFLTLYRVNDGDVSWTARNKFTSNDWRFRGDLFDNDDFKVYSEKRVTHGASSPTGGGDGDIYMRYGVGVYMNIGGTWTAMFS